MELTQNFDQILSRLGRREIQRYLTEEDDIRYSQEMVDNLASLVAHPGWQHLMDFAAYYAVRDMAYLADVVSDPESAVALNPEAGLSAPLDGSLWGAKMARHGGVIQGMRLICNFPQMIKEHYHERAESATD